MTLAHRPSVGVRSVIALLGFGIVVSNAMLLLSDRAPGLLRTLFGDLAQRITDRLDANGTAEAALDARDIGNDSIVHFGLWAVATIVIGLAVWSWAGLAVAALTVAASSLALEVAQGRYSSSRAVEASDAAFNLLGVAAGVTVVSVLYLAVDAAGRVIGLARRSGSQD